MSGIKNLDAMRRMVILDLSYNLGLNGLLKFKQFIKAIEDKIMLWLWRDCKKARISIK